ncbi:hypothetical protein QOT17_019659 [Balamuthia mandrillaris]
MSTPKESVYSHYIMSCMFRGLKPVSSSVFGRIMHKVFPALKSSRKGASDSPIRPCPRGKEKHHYKDLGVRSDHDPALLVNQQTESPSESNNGCTNAQEANKRKRKRSCSTFVDERLKLQTHTSGAAGCDQRHPRHHSTPPATFYNPVSASWSPASSSSSASADEPLGRNPGQPTPQLKREVAANPVTRYSAPVSTSGGSSHHHLPSSNPFSVSSGSPTPTPTPPPHQPQTQGHSTPIGTSPLHYCSKFSPVANSSSAPAPRFMEEVCSWELGPIFSCTFAEDLPDTLQQCAQHFLKQYQQHWEQVFEALLRGDLKGAGHLSHPFWESVAFLYPLFEERSVCAQILDLDREAYGTLSDLIMANSALGHVETLAAWCKELANLFPRFVENAVTGVLPPYLVSRKVRQAKSFAATLVHRAEFLCYLDRQSRNGGSHLSAPTAPEVLDRSLPSHCVH